MPRVPKKNISNRIADIFKDKESEGNDAETPRVDEGEPASLGAPLPILEMKRPAIGRLVVIFLVCASFMLIVLGVRAYERGKRDLALAGAEFDRLQNAVPDLRNLEFDAAREKLSAGGVSDQPLGVSGFGDGKSLQEVLVDFGGLFKSAGGSYVNLQTLTGQALALVSNLGAIEERWPSLLFRGQGAKMIQLMTAVRDNLGSIITTSNELVTTSKQFSSITGIDPASYLDLQIELYRGKQFLDAFIPWLSSDERHLAVFFENSSELRPGGGFIGSYADVTVRKGSIALIDVHDINDADRLFDPKIVPPKELQGIIRRFRAADANWFFDFSTSAEKTLAFLDRSNLYASSGRKFDGAIGLTPTVVSDVLARVGPIVLSPKLTITKDNFLAQIQEEVQAGQAAKAISPKAILTQLTPAIIERLTSTSSAWQSGDLQEPRSWIEGRDLRLYMRDAALQSFLESVLATGRVFAVPSNWNGDYLAVVNANIGGAKTDVVMKQTVRFESQVGADGVVTDQVQIERFHGGRATKDWWYRETNQNYLKLFTVPDSRLLAASGTIKKIVTAKEKYVPGDYETDLDLKSIEDSMKELAVAPNVMVGQEAGHMFFGTWTRTLLGTTSTITFDYSHRMFTPPKDGDTYTIVLEKQSGATGAYHVEVSAPVGFRWKENSLPIYEYDTNDLPGRLILELTFEKVL